MVDHFVWHDVAKLVPVTEMLKPPRNREWKPPSPDQIDKDATRWLRLLVDRFGREKVKTAMEAEGYMPLRTCPVDEQFDFVSRVTRRLKQET